MGTANFGLVGLDWERYVRLDEAYARPAEVPDLRGDPSKARRELGWEPRITFEAMIHEMLDNDLRALGLDPTEHLKSSPAPA